MINTVKQVVAEDGFAGLMRHAVAFVYRRGIRPLLPESGQVLYAGIRVAYKRKLGDLSVPQQWRSHQVEDRPEYEAALVAGLEEFARPGDRVVVVGGGVGVTATIAALKVGSSGSVQCFEGAGEYVGLVQRTAKLNGVAERITVRHAVVARSISVYGTEPDSPVVTPAELPDCDVLEMDCEGAEVDILNGMLIRPRVILVETHGLYGAPTHLVTSLLRDRGYVVDDRGVADPRVKEFCEENDVRVLAAIKDDGSSTA